MLYGEASGVGWLTARAQTAGQQVHRQAHRQTHQPVGHHQQHPDIAMHSPISLSVSANRLWGSSAQVNNRYVLLHALKFSVAVMHFPIISTAKSRRCLINRQEDSLSLVTVLFCTSWLRVWTGVLCQCARCGTWIMINCVSFNCLNVQQMLKLQ